LNQLAALDPRTTADDRVSRRCAHRNTERLLDERPRRREPLDQVAGIRGAVRRTILEPGLGIRATIRSMMSRVRAGRQRRVDLGEQRGRRQQDVLFDERERRTRAREVLRPASAW